MRTVTKSGETEAVVVGCSLNGLGVARSLVRAGINVTAVGTRYTGAALWSRHASAHLIRGFTGEPFIEDMIELGKTFTRRPILFLTLEECVHPVSEGRERLSKWFRIRLPDDHSVKILSDKSKFHEFASGHGFPVPRSVVLETENDLEKLSQLQFPCVLKPDDKRKVLVGSVDRAVLASSLVDAQEQARSTLTAGIKVIAQEWIEGPDSNIYFTLFYRGASGRNVSAFTGRKLLSYPRQVGSTAVCVGAPEVRRMLEPMTMDFAERAGFEGMGSMEYKWDENYKKFMMIEPTVGRTDWQEEIATLCGTNIPAAAFRHEVGLPPARDDAEVTGVAWRASIADRVPRHLRTGPMRVFDGYFRWDDPLPALQHYCLVNPIRHILKRWKSKTGFDPSGDSPGRKVAG
ncbi:Carboxylate--amine ligase [Burkholderia sp. 8Y]|uniref:carboxylate--amine ligase n=1 Tax=Burkholderia sp. 8Y TaxID=2653133 RepID=UPI0012F250F1|nr:carboxylate--amine ligase [Burkholderia sp. 8Y]VXC16782.1 Carboxylate--amine ligase [Burkholderia sp. 8Y]